MSEWISVEDSLPLNTEEVLVADSYDYCIAYFQARLNKWVLSPFSICVNGDAIAELDLNVTHWQPLPEPPK